MLRYLAAAAVPSRKAAAGGATAAAATPLSSRARHAIKEVVKVVQTEEYQHHDPVTSFLKEPYLAFYFEATQRELMLTEEVVRNDFFLSEFKDEFLDNARYLISEAYCRIHQKIDIANLSERLNLSLEEGEKWIVNLILETGLGAGAKIDLEKVCQLLSPSPFLHFPFFLFLSLLFLWPPCLLIPLPSLERRRDKSTSPSGISKRHRKNPPAGCAHTSARWRHGTFWPTSRLLCGNGPATRASGHCQLID